MEFMKASEDINTVSLVYTGDYKIHRDCNKMVMEARNFVFALFK